MNVGRFTDNRADASAVAFDDCLRVGADGVARKSIPQNRGAKRHRHLCRHDVILRQRVGDDAAVIESLEHVVDRRDGARAIETGRQMLDDTTHERGRRQRMTGRVQHDDRCVIGDH
jgi:hypothetical protein